MPTGQLVTFDRPINQTPIIGFRPATAIREHIKKTANDMGISVNHYCNLVFAEFINKNRKVKPVKNYELKNLKKERKEAL